MQVCDVIVVVGAGAIGGLLAGYVSDAGEQVLCLDGWREHVDAINKSGLGVRGVRGEHRFPVRAITWDMLDAGALQGGAPEAIFVAVKSYDTERVARRISPLVSPGTPVVSLQNGVNEEVLARTLAGATVVGGVSEIGGVLEAPGQIVETRVGGGFLIGDLRGRRLQQLTRVQSLMAHCAPTELRPNIWSALWSKLAWNCAMNAISAITGLGQGEILVRDAGRRAIFGTIREVGAVAGAHGVSLEALSYLGIELTGVMAGDTRRRAQAEDAIVERYRAQKDKTTSMAQDVKRGRRTEVDYLNGWVVAKAEEVGMSACRNALLVRIVHEIESGTRTQALDQLEAVAQ